MFSNQRCLQNYKSAVPWSVVTGAKSNCDGYEHDMSGFRLKDPIQCRTRYFEASRGGADFRNGSTEMPYAVKDGSFRMIGTAIRPNWQASRIRCRRT